MHDEEGTFVKDGTLVINENNNTSNNPLSEWKIVFLDSPKDVTNVQKKQKRYFQNFEQSYLLTLIKNLKDVAIKELEEGKDNYVVMNNYNEVREAVIQELNYRGCNYPPDFEAINESTSNKTGSFQVIKDDTVNNNTTPINNDNLNYEHDKSSEQNNVQNVNNVKDIEVQKNNHKHKDKKEKKSRCQIY